jgi:ferric-dicitrate binding protein FerR (iron transport regulator)
VKLNADSKITYHPYWWNFSREIRFEGEGFFEVKKGKKFRVISNSGTTEVLGTSFNIYSREKEYKVTCITGQVKVTSFAMSEVVLSPDYSAQVSTTGEIIMTKEADASDTHAWIGNMFRFTSKPLGHVIQEIARQYNVRITLKSPVDLTYTGFFSKNRPLEETLTLVCTPFGLNFAKISEKEYVISQN